MKALKVFVLTLLLVSMLAGCAAHVYTMGSGPQQGMVDQQRQWYVLWGLVTLNNVDVGEMIGDETNYEVRTASEPLDIVIGMFTGCVTVSSRTVTVKK